MYAKLIFSPSKSQKIYQWSLSKDLIPDSLVDDVRTFSFNMMKQANDVGHDIEHLEHVFNISSYIIRTYYSHLSPDTKRLILICALAHENGDHKLKLLDAGYEKTRDFITDKLIEKKVNIPKDMIIDISDYVYNIIKEIGVSKATLRNKKIIKNHKYIDSVEFAIASDADILAQSGAMIMIRGARMCAQKGYSIMTPNTTRNDKYNCVIKFADRIKEIEDIDIIKTTIAKYIFQKNKLTTLFIKYALNSEFYL